MVVIFIRDFKNVHILINDSWLMYKKFSKHLETWVISYFSPKNLKWKS